MEQFASLLDKNIYRPFKNLLCQACRLLQLLIRENITKIKRSKTYVPCCTPTSPARIVIILPSSNSKSTSPEMMVTSHLP